MHSYQQAHLNAVKPNSTIDHLNAVLTYIEFFKSSMTDCELLTAILDQMDKYSVHLNIIKRYNNTFLKCVNQDLIPGPVTLACVKLYEIITELEDKCKHDLTNKQQ